MCGLTQKRLVDAHYRLNGGAVWILADRQPLSLTTTDSRPHPTTLYPCYRVPTPHIHLCNPCLPPSPPPRARATLPSQSFTHNLLTYTMSGKDEARTADPVERLAELRHEVRQKTQKNISSCPSPSAVASLSRTLRIATCSNANERVVLLRAHAPSMMCEPAARLCCEAAAHC